MDTFSGLGIDKAPIRESNFLLCGEGDLELWYLSSCQVGREEFPEDGRPNKHPFFKSKITQHQSCIEMFTYLAGVLVKGYPESKEHLGL